MANFRLILGTPQTNETESLIDGLESMIDNFGYSLASINTIGGSISPSSTDAKCIFLRDIGYQDYFDDENYYFHYYFQQYNASSWVFYAYVDKDVTLTLTKETPVYVYSAETSAKWQPFKLPLKAGWNILQFGVTKSDNVTVQTVKIADANFNDIPWIIYTR